MNKRKPRVIWVINYHGALQGCYMTYGEAGRKACEIIEYEHSAPVSVVKFIESVK